MTQFDFDRPASPSHTYGRRNALRSIATAAAVAAAPAISRAQPGKITMKLGISLASTHPTVVGLQAAAAEIARKSNGQLNIDVLPNSQLGSDVDMLSQLRSGAIELFCTAGGIWGTLVPAAGITGVAFAFPDSRTAFAAMDGDLGAHIRAGFSKFGLVAQSKIWDHGFRAITTSTKPIVTAQDLVGLKLRVPAIAVLQGTFRTLGAAPTTIGIGEVYTALQTKVVDGQENPLAVIDAQRFYEVQKFCSLTAHAWDGFWIAANQRAWNALPENLRQLAWRIFDAQAEKQRETLAALNASLQDNLTKRGLAFNTVKPDSFREGLQKGGFYKEYQSRFGSEAWTALEKYSGKLA